ncbi:MAG: RNA 2'-phosphotransferase [Chloroflexaceae bacterium]|nr:RNA 2'-phosphotransferase [Chloroflexaceae bacterium]
MSSTASQCTCGAGAVLGTCPHCKHLITCSRYLSKHLRHTPERIGLTLAPGGWVDINVLLAACARHNMPISRAELDELVQRNSKQRFAFDATGQRIRANQGHTVAVDLQLEPATPPPILYHGTGAGAVPAILETGLHRMQRHHVHLSPDIETARRVGARHGKPVVLQIDTAAMQQAGHLFYRAENGVWLTDHVPPEYLCQL